MPRLDRLIETAPPHIAELFAVPGRGWPGDARMQVVEWLAQAANIALLRRSVHAHFNVSQEDADDIVAAYLEDLLKRPSRLARYNPPGPSAAYSAGTFFARFIDADLERFASVKVRDMRSVTARESNRTFAYAPAEPTGPERRERQSRAVARLSKSELSDREYDVIALQLEGQKPDEIAASLAITAGRVKATAARAVKKLRRLFELNTHRTAEAVGPSSGDPVECTVFGPSSAPPGEQALIQVFVHVPNASEEVLQLAREFDDLANMLGRTSLWARIVVGTHLTFTLSVPGFAVDETSQTMVWRGRPQNVSFGVTVPADHPDTSVVGTVVVAVEAIPIGQLKFRFKVRRHAARRENTSSLGESAKRYELAFISYASQDRDKVLPRVQMLRLFGIKYFQDVLDLEPGDRWARQLFLYINECDLFLLFWSKAAKTSEWVMNEVRHALNRQNGDPEAPPAIHPVIIEGPPVEVPPPELQHLHFDDKLSYFMGSRQS
jgi:RNA polymerase sigma factor (sigma-70 family)